MPERRRFLDTTQAYLATLYVVDEETGAGPTRAALGRQLELTASAVCEYVERLSRQGLVILTDDLRVALTGTGRPLAARVVRKRRIVERLLVDVVGLGWEAVADEAARWQHVIGENAERKILALLDHPARSPFGSPIPALPELLPWWPEPPAGAPPVAVSCARLAVAGGGHGTVDRVLASAQGDPELLVALGRAGARPGATVEVAPTGPDGACRLSTASADALLDGAAARAVLVDPGEPETGDHSSGPGRAASARRAAPTTRVHARPKAASEP